MQLRIKLLPMHSDFEVNYKKLSKIVIKIPKCKKISDWFKYRWECRSYHKHTSKIKYNANQHTSIEIIHKLFVTKTNFRL